MAGESYDVKISGYKRIEDERTKTGIDSQEVLQARKELLAKFSEFVKSNQPNLNKDQKYFFSLLVSWYLLGIYTSQGEGFYKNIETFLDVKKLSNIQSRNILEQTLRKYGIIDEKSGDECEVKVEPPKNINGEGEERKILKIIEGIRRIPGLESVTRENSGIQLDGRGEIILPEGLEKGEQQDTFRLKSGYRIMNGKAEKVIEERKVQDSNEEVEKVISSVITQGLENPSLRQTFIKAFSKVYLTFLKEEQLKTLYKRQGELKLTDIVKNKSLIVRDKTTLLELLDKSLDTQTFQEFSKASFPQFRLKIQEEDEGKIYEREVLVRIKDPKQNEKVRTKQNDEFIQSLSEANWGEKEIHKNLNSYISSLLKEIFPRELSGKLEENKILFQKNIRTLIQMFAAIESSYGKEVEHTSSSAKGVFQFLTGVINGDKVDLFDINEYPDLNTKTTFAVYMSRIKYLFGGDEYKNSPYKEQIDGIFSQSKENRFFDLRALPGEIQTVILIGQLFQRAKSDSTLRNLILSVLVKGSHQDAGKIYEKYHNTSQGIIKTDNHVKTAFANFSNAFQGIKEPEREAILKALGLEVKIEGVAKGVKEKVEKLTYAETNIQDAAVEKTIRQILTFLGYEQKINVKDMLLAFQTDKGIQNPNGNYGPGTKEKLKEILLTILDEKKFIGKDGKEVIKADLEKILVQFSPGEPTISQSTSRSVNIEEEKKTPYSETEKKQIIEALEKQENKNFFIQTYGKMGYDMVKKMKQNGTSKAEVMQFMHNRLYLLQEKAETVYNTVDEDVSIQTIGESLYGNILKTAQGKNLKYSKNYSRVIASYLGNPWYRGNGLYIKNAQEAQSLLNTGKLVPIESKTDVWRRKGSISTGNPLEFSITPKTKEILESIAKQFKIESRGHTIVLNSILRPVDYNSKISGASLFSAHTNGTAFDIGFHHFDFNGDIITDQKPYIEKDNIKVNPLKVNELTQILWGILKKMDTDGKIILTWESDHPHITVIQR